MMSFRMASVFAVLAVASALKVSESPMAAYARAKNVTVESSGCGYLCGGGGPIDSATKAQVAGILEGILGGLQRGSLLASAVKVGKVGNATAQKKPETPAPVKHALQSLLSSMQSVKGQYGAKAAFAKMVSSSNPDVGDYSCTYFQSCAEEDHPIDSQTKAQVASILEGILNNLSKQKFLQVGESPLAALARAKNATPTETSGYPFGFGAGGSDHPISAATKAQVASILEGILGGLQKGSLLASAVKVGKVGNAATQKKPETPAPVKHALQSLLSSMQSVKGQYEAKAAFSKILSSNNPDVGDYSCTYFQVCGEEDHPINSQTKAQVAGILEGILNNLSKHK